jgi:hypothetical protein
LVVWWTQVLRKGRHFLVVWWWPWILCSILL